MQYDEQNGHTAQAIEFQQKTLTLKANSPAVIH